MKGVVVLLLGDACSACSTKLIGKPRACSTCWIGSQHVIPVAAIVSDGRREEQERSGRCGG